MQHPSQPTTLKTTRRAESHDGRLAPTISGTTATTETAGVTKAVLVNEMTTTMLAHHPEAKDDPADDALPPHPLNLTHPLAALALAGMTVELDIVTGYGYK